MTQATLLKTRPTLIHYSTSLTKGLSYNIHPAHSFLRAFDSNAKFFTFQTFDDSPLKRPQLTQLIHCRRFKNKINRLNQLNNRGAGIYFAINQTDEIGCKIENIIRVRTFVLDLDGAPLKPVINQSIKPHLVVETSPRKYHAYYIVKNCPLDARKYKQLQQALANQFNGDQVVCNLNRVMRLPGFYHCKNKPIISKLIQKKDHPPFEFEVLNEWIESLSEASPLPARGVSRYAQPLSASNNGFDSLKGIKAAEVKIGQRNHYLYQTGFKMGVIGYGISRITDKLIAINNQFIDKLTETEVIRQAERSHQQGRNLRLKQRKQKT